MDSPMPPPLPPRRAAPAKKKSRKTLYLVLGLGLGIPLLLVLLVVGATLLFELTSSSEPVGTADRALLLDAEAVAEWLEGYEVQPNTATVTKTRYIDGSYELDYEYEDDRDDDYLYVTSNVSIERKVSDAITVFATLELGVKIGADDVEFDKRPDLLRWGDATSCAILRQDGEPFGNFVIARKGKRVYMIVISGVYFDEPDALQELIVPFFERLDGYTP